MSNISRVGGKIEEAKLEPETKVENIDEIKSNHMKKIFPLDIKLSDIISINAYSYSEPISTNKKHLANILNTQRNS